MTAPIFQNLTFAVQPVITAGGALNTAAIIPGTTIIAGILDPVSTQRVFNPIAEGNAVVSGDAYTAWLPKVPVGGLTATTVVDNLQSGTPTEFGQIQLQLTPAVKNVVEASSVMKFYLSPQALIITATAGTF